MALILWTVVTRAQSPTPVLIETAATVATCQPTTLVPAPIVMCVTADSHIAVAGNGTTFATIGGNGGLVVTSWNGQTGAVTYAAPTPPVTSVNGKTGAVVLGATSTAPTVTVQ